MLPAMLPGDLQAEASLVKQGHCMIGRCAQVWPSEMEQVAGRILTLGTRAVIKEIIGKKLTVRGPLGSTQVEA